MLSRRLEHNLFDHACRHAAYGSGLPRLALKQSGADIVAVFDASLADMSWRHPVAAVVEHAAHQQRLRPASEGRLLVIDLLVEPCLHSLEQISIDNGRLFSGEGVTLEHHLA